MVSLLVVSLLVLLLLGILIVCYVTVCFFLLNFDLRKNAGGLYESGRFPEIPIVFMSTSNLKGDIINYRIKAKAGVMVLNRIPSCY